MLSNSSRTKYRPFSHSLPLRKGATSRYDTIIRQLKQLQSVSKYFETMFYRIFFSPLKKRWAITTYKHGIYELPHELPKDLRPRVLGK